MADHSSHLLFASQILRREHKSKTCGSSLKSNVRTRTCIYYLRKIHSIILNWTTSVYLLTLCQLNFSANNSVTLKWSLSKERSVTQVVAFWHKALQSFHWTHRVSNSFQHRRKRFQWFLIEKICSCIYLTQWNALKRATANFGNLFSKTPSNISLSDLTCT